MSEHRFFKHCLASLFLAGFMLCAQAQQPLVDEASLEADTTTVPASTPDTIADAEPVTESEPAVETQPAADVAPDIVIAPPASPAVDIFGAATDSTYPSDIVLLLDNSGSMKKNDPEFLMSKAVTEFITQLDRNTRLAMVIFDQKVQLAAPLTDVDDSSRQGLLDSLKLINYKGLHTNSPDGLERAIYELKLHARPDTEQFIVFLTDGIVDTGDKQKDIIKTDWMRKELAADAREHNIRIFGIAFTDQADFQLIQSLAQQTEAEYFRAYNASDIASVFSQIQARINQARLERMTPPEPEVIEEPEPEPVVAPAPPPKPIIVTVPEKVKEEDPMMKYLLFGIAGLLVLVLAVVLLRGRGAAPAAKDAATADMPQVNLVDLQQVTGQKDYPLKTRLVQIGRVKGKESPDVSHIIVNESGVSRHHAVIEYRNHAFWLMDQGSGNGTFLNGVKVNEEQRLKHGDIVRIDKHEFMFYEPEMEQSDATVVQSSSSQAAPAAPSAADFGFDDIEETAIINKDSATPAPAAAPQQAEEEILHDFDDWGFAAPADDEEESEAPTQFHPADESEAATPPPEAATPPPEDTQASGGFQPARTLSSTEFDKLFHSDEEKEEEPSLEKTDFGGFQAAKTMTPKEFEKLFDQIEKNKKK